MVCRFWRDELKIYCILLDTTPLDSPLRNFFIQRKFKQLNQIANCYTTSTIISMFTSKLSTDLMEGGIGSHSWQVYIQKETGGVRWPFEEKEYITNLLHRKGWNIEFHTPNTPSNISCISYTVTSDRRYKWTSCENEIVELEILQDGQIAKNHFKKEKKHIERMQLEPNDKNKFYFVHYYYYHTALIKKQNAAAAVQKQIKILDCWNFNESNSLFWIFQDHGNFRKFNKYCAPNAFFTWVQFKDNSINSLQTETNFISIRDFYPTILKKLKINYKGNNVESKSIDEKQSNERVYFSEDNRSEEKINTRIMTFMASKFVHWKKQPTTLRSVTYYMPNKKFFCYELDLKTEKISQIEIIDNHLKSCLIQRYSWLFREK